MAQSRITICNQALARLPAKPIQSLDENSLEARECNRFYPQVVADMLEGPNDWSFQTRRSPLVAVENDRGFEWVYAYGLPSDVAVPTRVIPDLSAAGLGFPLPLPGDPYTEVWALSGRFFETPYIIEDGTLYTNVTGAILEYRTNSVNEAVLSALVGKAIGLQLAAELALPVKKDAKLRQTILGEAEMAWDRARAEDQNRQPQVSGDYVSETMLARKSGFWIDC